jgi:hypothetical protein
MIAYLHHVAATWNSILKCGNEVVTPSRVDTATVERLELLAPRHSIIDRELVLSMMRNRELFSSEPNDDIRKKMLDNICNHSGIIPSIWTFFETLKYLEPICEALKKLIGGKIKQSIRASLKGCYFAPAKTVVQVSGSRDMELDTDLNIAQVASIPYVELWAFCARHFDDLTTFTPKMECGGNKPLVKGPNPVVWQKLARFAISRGFLTLRAKELSQDDSHSQLAMAYLRKANPLIADFSTAQVQKVVAASQPDASVDDNDLNPDDEFVKVERRSGRPYELDLAKDKRSLFFAHLYDSQTPGKVNLNFVRRDLFSCLFADLRLPVCFSWYISNNPDKI